jgi:hypothetical protein
VHGLAPNLAFPSGNPNETSRQHFRERERERELYDILQKRKSQLSIVHVVQAI